MFSLWSPSVSSFRINQLKNRQPCQVRHAPYAYYAETRKSNFTSLSLTAPTHNGPSFPPVARRLQITDSGLAARTGDVGVRPHSSSAAPQESKPDGSRPKSFSGHIGSRISSIRFWIALFTPCDGPFSDRSLESHHFRILASTYSPPNGARRSVRKRQRGARKKKPAKTQRAQKKKFATDSVDIAVSDNALAMAESRVGNSRAIKRQGPRKVS